MLRNRALRWSLGLLAVGGLAGGVAFGGGVGGFGGGGKTPGGEGHYAAFDALHEAANEGQAGKNGEAPREGPSTPAEEQVGNRAYPRSYVDDRLARRERQAFARVPNRPARTSFSSGAAYRRAVASTETWNALGPQTPNVVGEASQFIDPTTGEGPATQESGRVTALAIDPACGTTLGDCRLWVAAAGGGIWRTEDALASPVDWIEPAADLPTNSFGSLYFDAEHNTLYAGSGEPNGSGDSEAGLGLFESIDFGASWTQVPGSVAVATNRSIGAIAIDPNTNPATIYIGTDVARHGSSSVNGGRFTPPGAPALGVYRSDDGGATFSLEADLSTETPPSPNLSQSGADWFQGGITKLELDPNNPNMLYAGVFGYGIWRADQSVVGEPSWEQVFHTMNQNDFSNTAEPGDKFGDRTEFDMAALGTETRMYVGDASDELTEALSPELPEAWRNDDVAAITGSETGELDNEAQGWIQLSSELNGTTGFGVYNYCQNGQCGYDSFVAHPPGASPETVWYGGSMNYGELAAYGGEPPRSNGRAVIRSTNGGEGTAATASNEVEWHDMTAVLKGGSSPGAWGVEAGVHPDLHAIAFANGGNTAFIGSDGGVVRIDVSSPQNQSASCFLRSLPPPDLLDCLMLLNGVPSAIEPLNDGLNDLQFQSLSFDPANPAGSLLGGTQDNGTWGYEASAEPGEEWLENVGGDGGQSGFDRGNGEIRYHNYYDATPEVNFEGNNPTGWFDIYDPLQVNEEEKRSFYTPFIADPLVAGRAFTGLEFVWRTNDNGGSKEFLEENGCSIAAYNPSGSCGDWRPMGANLTASGFGASRQGQYVVAIARAPSDAGTLWAATRTGRLFVTKNANASQPGAVSFDRIDTAATPGRFVSGIAVDPVDPNHAWISYSGYNVYTPSTEGHVFEVHYDPVAHSASFEDLSANLDDQPVTAVAEDRLTCDLYAATDFGVLKLPVGSSEWIDSGAGLPAVAVYGLSLSQSGRVLYAATHGRGAYALSLPTTAPCPGPSPPPIPTPIPIPIPIPTPGTGTGTNSTPRTGAKATVRASLGRIQTVKLGRKTTIGGTASAPGGVAVARLAFGDGHTRTLALEPNGTFRVRHRYRRAKTFRVRLSVTGTGGEFARTSRNAHVKPKHKNP